MGGSSGEGARSVHSSVARQLSAMRRLCSEHDNNIVGAHIYYATSVFKKSSSTRHRLSPPPTVQEHARLPAIFAQGLLAGSRPQTQSLEKTTTHSVWLNHPWEPLAYP